MIYCSCFGCKSNWFMHVFFSLKVSRMALFKFLVSMLWVKFDVFYCFAYVNAIESLFMGVSLRSYSIPSAESNIFELFSSRI